MLTSIDFKFILNYLFFKISASLGDKGLFSSVNILQIMCRVLLLFLVCF